MFSYNVIVYVKCNYHICIMPTLESQKETHMITLSHKCRDNVCPPPSSPMVDFNIELYGAISQDLRI